uniref:Uncharacterized protein n=1 Tax=Moniliophthora roreri TaxID=221103 RepID=A0A0W0G153_MONRR
MAKLGFKRCISDTSMMRFS